MPDQLAKCSGCKSRSMKLKPSTYFRQSSPSVRESRYEALTAAHVVGASEHRKRHYLGCRGSHTDRRQHLIRVCTGSRIWDTINPLKCQNEPKKHCSIYCGTLSAGCQGGELGVSGTVMESSDRLILGREFMWKEVDVEETVPILSFHRGQVH